MAAEVEDEDEWHKNVGDEEDKVCSFYLGWTPVL